MPLILVLGVGVVAAFLTSSACKISAAAMPRVFPNDPRIQRDMSKALRGMARNVDRALWLLGGLLLAAIAREAGVSPAR